MIKKRLKNNIDISKPNGGPSRNSQIVEEYDENTTYLPRPISIEDIEGGVIDSFTSGEFSMTIDGKVVPVIYMTNERWADFAKTWEYSDGDKNTVPPYILLKRTTIKKGTYYEGLYNTPVKVYEYYKVPTFENGLYGYDLYKIPQPTAIDIDYEIMFVSRYVEDTNIFIETMLNGFKRLQYTIRVNGHFFRIHRDEEFGDDSTMNDSTKDRYHIVKTNINLKAYTLNAKDFEVTKAFNRMVGNVNIK